MKITFLLFIYLIFQSPLSSQNQSEELAERIINKYRSHSLVSYQIDYEMHVKFLSENIDTLTVNGRVEIARIPEDTVLGGHIRIRLDSIPIEYYITSSDQYIISHINKTIFQSSSHSEGSPYFMSSKVYFLDPERLLSYARDTSITIQLEEDEFAGIPVWRWINNYKDMGDIKDIQEKIWIRRADLAIIRILFSAKTKDDKLYQDWNLSNIVYDNTTVEQMREEWSQLKSEYTLKPK